MAALFNPRIIADNVGNSLSDYDAFISAKKELKVAIDAKMKSLHEIKLKLDGVEKKLNELNNIFPDAEMKKKEIAEYDESLSRIESMFENRWKIMVEGVPLWFVIIFVIGLILYLLKSVFSGFLGDVASVQWYYECEIFRTTWLLPNREKHWFIEN